MLNGIIDASVAAKNTYGKRFAFLAEFMDDLAYEYKDGQNMLTLKKKI